MLNKEQAEWQEERKSLIGSSEIGIICGLSEYSSPLQLWMEKTGRKERQNQDSPFLIYGNAVEGAIGTLFRWHNKQYNIVESNQTFKHSEHDYLCATPDFFITPIGEEHPQAEIFGGLEDEEGILEVKHTKQFWDEIPLMYQLQLQWQLGLLGKGYGAIFAVCGGDVANPRCVFYKFDQSIYDFAMEKVLAFKKSIDDDTPPEANRLDKSTLADIFTKPIEAPIDIPEDETAEVLEKYLEAKKMKSDLAKEVKYWENEFKDVEAKLIQKLKGHSLGKTTLKDRKYTLKNNRVLMPPKMVNGYQFFRFSVKEGGNE